MSIFARQCRWGSNAGNQATEKKKKANPEIDIPEITTKAAPAIVIENYVPDRGGQEDDGQVRSAAPAA